MQKYRVVLENRYLLQPLQGERNRRDSAVCPSFRKRKNINKIKCLLDDLQLVSHLH